MHSRNILNSGVHDRHVNICTHRTKNCNSIFNKSCFAQKICQEQVAHHKRATIAIEDEKFARDELFDEVQMRFDVREFITARSIE